MVILAVYEIDIHGNRVLDLIFFFIMFWSHLGGGVSESMDGWGCAILALEVVPKNLIFA